MGEKKQKGKQAWCLNTVATLKPFIERKEHITRSTAARLVKPVTNWQRRELDNLRKQANQIIRGENCNPLTYTIFGMSLDHPDLHGVRDEFIKTVDEYKRLFTLPPSLNIVGSYPTAEQLFDKGNKPSPGDMYAIGPVTDGVGEIIFIEDGETYVSFTLNKGKPADTGIRCIYPECIKVADVERNQQPPVVLNWIKNIDRTDELPATGNVGDMYGVYNGRTQEPDIYMVWAPEGRWCEIMRNEQNDGEIYAAKMSRFVEQYGLKDKVGKATKDHLHAYAQFAGVNRAVFIKELPTYGYLREHGTPGEVYDITDLEDIGIATVGWAGDDWVDVCDLTRKVPHKRYRSYSDQAPATDIAAHRHAGGEGITTTPHLKRKNPVINLYIADDRTAAILDRDNSYRYHCDMTGVVAMHKNEMWMRVGDMWVDYNASYPRVVGTTNDKPVCDHTLLFITLQQFKELKPEDIVPGMAYINEADHIVAWVNQEWVDMGPFHHSLGLQRNDRNEVWYKSEIDLIEEQIGVRSNFKNFIKHWGELPVDPEVGDMYAIMRDVHDYPDWSSNCRAVWDGEVWLDGSNHKAMITIPNFIVKGAAEPEPVKPEQQPADTAVDKPGFWSRVGKVFGFK